MHVTLQVIHEKTVVKHNFINNNTIVVIIIVLFILLYYLNNVCVHLKQNDYDFCFHVIPEISIICFFLYSHPFSSVNSKNNKFKNQNLCQRILHTKLSKKITVFKYFYL